MTKYIIGLSCLLLMLAGCGGSTGERVLERQIEQQTGSDADVDISGDNLNITGETEDGAFSLSSGEGTKVPEDFPEDVLVYSPASVGSAMVMPEGLSLTLKTDDGAEKIKAAYKSEMIAKGWSEQASMDMGTQSMLAYKKGDRATNITIVPSDEGTQIMIIVGKE
jgi:hypothetical protein